MEHQIINQNYPNILGMQTNNIQFEYTSKQISEGFECSETTIRDCKSNNKDFFIEGIDWKMEPVGTSTGLKETVLWSKEGIIKLASKLRLTPKAIEFLIEIKSEEKNKIKAPKTFAEALRLAADQQEQIEKQQALLIEQKPKVDLANSIIGHRTNFSVKEFIDNFKIIVGKNKFLEILRNDGLLMDHPNRNHPYQQYSKYFKIQRVIKNEESREKILITPEGYVYLSKKYQNLMEKIEVDYLIED
jgi:phage antirepressor YoqD-like protein